MLRRDALMQLGIVGYVRAVEREIPKVLRTAESIITKAQREAKESDLFDSAALQRLAAQDMSPFAAVESVRALVAALDVERRDEAQPVMPMATISVTEDMATAMRLHGLGWKSVYHLFLYFGVRPVNSYGPDFLWHLLPYLVLNQVLFIVIGYGKRTWRGTQYSLALFPLWIRATWTAVANVVFKRSLGFVVTPKTRVDSGPPWRLIWPQLLAMGLLAVGAVYGTVRYLTGIEPSLISTVVNIFWVAFDLIILSVIISAARYTGRCATRTAAGRHSG